MLGKRSPSPTAAPQRHAHREARAQGFAPIQPTPPGQNHGEHACPARAPPLTGGVSSNGDQVADPLRTLPFQSYGTSGAPPRATAMPQRRQVDGAPDEPHGRDTPEGPGGPATMPGPAGGWVVR
jgi:hypothetical protein